MNKWVIIAIVAVVAWFLYTNKKKQGDSTGSLNTIPPGTFPDTATLPANDSTVPNNTGTVPSPINTVPASSAKVRQELLQAVSTAKNIVSSKIMFPSEFDSIMDSILDVARKYGTTSMISEIEAARKKLSGGLPTQRKALAPNVFDNLIKTVDIYI